MPNESFPSRGKILLMAGIYDGIKQPPTNSDRPEAMIPYPPLRPVHSPSYDAATATRDRDAPPYSDTDVHAHPSPHRSWSSWTPQRSKSCSASEAGMLTCWWDSNLYRVNTRPGPMPMNRWSRRQRLARSLARLWSLRVLQWACGRRFFFERQHFEKCRVHRQFWNNIFGVEKQHSNFGGIKWKSGPLPVEVLWKFHAHWNRVSCYHFRWCGTGLMMREIKWVLSMHDYELLMSLKIKCE